MKNPTNSNTKTLIQESIQTSTPWMVLIYDDPVNLMQYVTLTIQRVLGYNKEKAENLMMNVHENGKAIVWSGNKEKAEFYVQQLHSFQLKATLEAL